MSFAAIDAAGRPLARRAATALLLLLLAGCSSLSTAPPRSRPGPGPTPSPQPQSPEARRETVEPRRPGEAPTALPPTRPRSNASSASQALLTQSRAERAAGSYPQATASLERALRIDPNNAELWVELGEIQLATGNRDQAQMMARKALTLAGGNAAVESQADRLLRAAGR